MKTIIFIWILTLMLSSCGKGGGSSPSAPPPPVVVIEGKAMTGTYNFEAVTCISTTEPIEITAYSELTHPTATIEITGNNFVEKFDAVSGYVQVERKAVFNEDDLLISFSSGKITETRDFQGEPSSSTGISFMFSASLEAYEITPNPLGLIYGNNQTVVGGTKDYYYDEETRVLFISTSYWEVENRPNDLCFTVLTKN